MQHYTQLSDVQLGKTWLTIGSFDGVHLGHQMLLKKLVDGAHADRSQAVVLTFNPHPVVVLRGKNEPYYLCSIEEKLELFDALGIDQCITMEFNLTVASYTAQLFMHMLTRQMKIQRLLVGQDFALGRGRTGDIATLSKIGEQEGFLVDVVEPVSADGVISSSSQIRRSISEGKVDIAAHYLGRDYSITGLVSHGDGRGKTIGFPTANVAVPRLRLLPATGVYACWITIDQKKYPSVANIGVRPTFHLADHTQHLEVHVLDLNQDLYGQLVKVEFVKHLRSEVKFSSVEQLVEQIKKDVEQAKEIL